MAEMTNTPPMRRADGDSPIWITTLLLALAVLAIVGVVVTRQDANMNTWIRALGVIVTLCILTILYKDNPLFRFVEHIFIGLATGYGLVLLWFRLVEPEWFTPMMPKSLVHNGQGHWWMISALLLGALFFTVYTPKLAWMNRFAVSVFMGWAAGNALQEFMGLLGPQFVAAFKATPLSKGAHEAVLGNNIHLWGQWYLHPWTLLALLVMTFVLSYFVFSVEHKSKIIRVPSSLGRYFLMITLGAIFGTTVMGRFSLIIERLNFLKDAFADWGMALWHLLAR